MKNYYLDTNVLLSQYKLSDPYYRESLTIAKSLKRGDVRGYTSTLTILEACSFISRNFPLKKSETPEEARSIAVSKTLKEFASLGLIFIGSEGDYTFRLNDQDVRMPAVFFQALTLTLYGLRTLDLLHLSVARYATKIGLDIRGFVSGDNDFIGSKKTISDIIGMSVISPKELIDTLGLE